MVRASHRLSAEKIYITVRPMIFYIICIMSFVWQSGTTIHPHEYLSTDLEIVIPRILISCILALGIVYLVLIGATFRRYGDPMEQAWQERIKGWLAEKTRTPAGDGGDYQNVPAHGQQNHAWKQAPKVAKKERQASAMYYPTRKKESPPPRSSAPSKSASMRNLPPPAPQAERPRSMNKARRPLFAPSGPRHPKMTNHPSMGRHSLAKPGNKEASKSVPGTATLSFDPFVSFAQVAPPIEQAHAKQLSDSTKHPEVEGGSGAESSDRMPCGEHRALTHIHELGSTHRRAAGSQEYASLPKGAGNRTLDVCTSHSDLEELEELLVFDWGTRSVRDAQETRAASTSVSSATMDSAPPVANAVPKRWLAVGLTADAWAGFCTISFLQPRPS